MNNFEYNGVKINAVVSKSKNLEYKSPTNDLVEHCKFKISNLKHSTLLLFGISYEVYDILQKPHPTKEQTKLLFDTYLSIIKKQNGYENIEHALKTKSLKKLLESDNNDECRNVCFGYAQTKWVAEQLVIQAAAYGLKAKIYRPTFLTASITTNGYNEFDIVSKYILFSLKYKVAAVGPNNINIFAVDLAAQNMMTLALIDDFYGKNFHLSSSYKDYVGVMADIVEKQLDIKFTRYNYQEFLEFLNKNATPNDQLYPLIPFANENYPYIKRMENKQYSNEYTKNCFKKYGLVYAERELGILLVSIIKYLRRKRLLLL